MINLPKRYTIVYSVIYDSKEKSWTALSDKVELSGTGATPELAIYELEKNLDIIYAKETN